MKAATLHLSKFSGTQPGKQPDPEDLPSTCRAGARTPEPQVCSSLERQEQVAGPAHLFEQAEQDVSGQGALVGLVQNDDAVPLQQRVTHGLPQQHAIRHIPAGLRQARKDLHGCITQVTIAAVWVQTACSRAFRSLPEAVALWLAMERAQGRL